MTRLAQLTRAKHWLDAFRPLPPAVVEELTQRYTVRLTYHSTAIEGNTLTQSETQIVIEKGITIGGKSVHEHLEVIGHKEALDFVHLLADAGEPMGEREIREVHTLVMKGQQAASDTGAYRTLDVRAAGTEFIYPPHYQVPERMHDFALWLRDDSSGQHPIERASEAHLRFVTIHPFRDGNGRVGRLLLNLLLLRAGYPIAVLPVERRNEYINALVAGQQKGRSDALLDLVIDAVESSLRETLQICATAGEAISTKPELKRETQAWLFGNLT